MKWWDVMVTVVMFSIVASLCAVLSQTINQPNPYARWKFGPPKDPNFFPIVEPKVSRPMSWRKGEALKVHLIVHGSIVEVFVGDTVSLASRIYEPKQGWLGIYSANGKVELCQSKIASLYQLP